MDLNAIFSTIKDTFEVEIFHPVTGDGGWIWELASPSNVEAQVKTIAILDRSKKRKTSTPAQEEKDGIDLIIARVISWKGLKNGTKDIPYSDEACAEILKNPKSFWIRKQLLDAIGDQSLPFSA